MGIDLAALATNVATTDVDFGESTITVKYRPSVATPANLKAVTADPDDEVGPFIDFLVKLLADWDITDGGTKVPITAEGIDAVPMNILQQVMRGVMADSQNAGEADAPSSNG